MENLEKIWLHDFTLSSNLYSRQLFKTSFTFKKEKKVILSCKTISAPDKIRCNTLEYEACVYSATFSMTKK